MWMRVRDRECVGEAGRPARRVRGEVIQVPLRVAGEILQLGLGLTTPLPSFVQRPRLLFSGSLDFQLARNSEQMVHPGHLSCPIWKISGKYINNPTASWTWGMDGKEKFLERAKHAPSPSPSPLPHTCKQTQMHTHTLT